MNDQHIPKFWNMTEQGILNQLLRLRAQGVMRDTKNGQFEPILPNVDFSNEYIFTTLKPHKDCLMAYDILFEQFNFVPPSICMDCWKVVIKSENVYELFQVWSLLKEHGIHGKSGIDMREFTFGFYPSFIYGASFEEGQANWIKVVNLLQEHIGGHFLKDYMKTVILKRGCTEMEGRLPSNKWQVTEQQLEAEALVQSFITPFPQEIHQPDRLIAHKMRRWCTKAHMIGDMSYKKMEPYVGDINYGVKVLTYHQHDWLKLDEAELQK